MNTELWQTQRDAGVAKEDRVALLSARDEFTVFGDTGTPDWWGEANPSVWVYRKAIEDAHHTPGGAKATPSTQTCPLPTRL